MNERIRELEKQCWSHRVDGALIDGHLHFDTKKFAELIVRECSQYIEDKFDFCGDEIIIAESVLKHFGVEE